MCARTTGSTPVGIKPRRGKRRDESPSMISFAAGITKDVTFEPVDGPINTNAVNQVPVRCWRRCFYNFRRMVVVVKKPH